MWVARKAKRRISVRRSLMAAMPTTSSCTGPARERRSARSRRSGMPWGSLLQTQDERRRGHMPRGCGSKHACARPCSEAALGMTGAGPAKPPSAWRAKRRTLCSAPGHARRSPSARGAAAGVFGQHRRGAGRGQGAPWRPSWHSRYMRARSPAMATCARQPPGPFRRVCCRRHHLTSACSCPWRVCSRVSVHGEQRRQRPTCADLTGQGDGGSRTRAACAHAPRHGAAACPDAQPAEP